MGYINALTITACCRSTVIKYSNNIPKIEVWATTDGNGRERKKAKNILISVNNGGNTVNA
jgi:hypothetical protein